MNVIVLTFLITGCILAEDSSKSPALSIKSDVILNGTVTSTTASPVSSSTTKTSTTTLKIKTSTTSTEFPLLEDLISAEGSSINEDKSGDNSDDEKNTAKRTISGKFTGPIVVDEETNLFTPADEFTRKQQINVQIIEPESHNNGQFLKETVFQRQENSITTTTSTTERPSRRKNIVVEQKFSAPIQVGFQPTNNQHRPDDDCDDDHTSQRANIAVTTQSARKILENVDIQQNTKIQKVYYKEEPKPNLAFGARVFSTTRPPCDQSLPCSTVRTYKPSSTPRLLPINTTPLPVPRVYTTPRIVTSTVVSAPRVVTSSAPLYTSTVSPVVAVTHARVRPVQPIVPVFTEKPIHIHTHSEVPVIHKEFVHLPPRVIEKPVIHKEYVQLPPQIQVVEKPRIVVQKELVQLLPQVQEKIIPVEVEKLVVKEVPITNIVEKHIQHPPTVIEKFVPYPVASKPIEIEKVVEVPVDRVVEKTVPVNHVVEKPVPVPVVQYVDRPIHIPYILPVEIPVAYHVPYIVQQPPPPPPQKHFIIKTTKYGKGHHGLFDWKHNFQKHNIKHVFIKKHNHILPEEIIAPPTIDSIGLLPPPRFQPYTDYYSDSFGPKAAASINIAHAVLPNSPIHNNQFFEPPPQYHNSYGAYENKIKYVDSFSKDIRWEFGFKPPLVPSVAIDEFGNPLNEH